MRGVDLSAREDDGHVGVVLCEELDMAGVAMAVEAREPQVIVDLAGLRFIDSSGEAALARGRKHPRHAGGDLLLAAPRYQVLWVLTLTRLIDVLPVHASVEEAAKSTAAPPAARPRRRGMIPARSPALHDRLAGHDIPGRDRDDLDAIPES
jgi:anti-anti-sigma factor